MTDYLWAKTENIQKLLNTRLKDQKEELISEFLQDWKWGQVYELHFSWLNFYDHCRCKPTTIGYWKWFENKWKKRRDI